MRFHSAAVLSLICAILLRLSDSSPPPYSCDSSDPQTKSYPFCRTSLSVDRRAQDIVSRLTLDEKIFQLVNTAPAIPRLGIPAYEWWSEALHGVSGAGYGIDFNGKIGAATSFPQVILTAASFDADLWYRIGQVIGKEARAVYNEGQAKGMTFWAPNINIFRDPRWGRGQETPGEDPLVTGKYAVAYVRGLQGDSFNGNGSLSGRLQLQASACCKHFTAYDLDNWKGVNRFAFDAKVTKQDLADTYQPPFKSCIKEARASGIMCAYNRVNGLPNCADYNLLTNTARRQWGFNGYITSDCDAVSIMHDNQGYAKTPEDAVADVLKAGMDVNCGSYLKNYTKSALQQNKLQESHINTALVHLFSIRIRLGLFDGNPAKQAFGNIGPDQVCSPPHRALALEAARDGIVLLKNTENLLPLRKTKALSLAVIGPNADSVKTLLGNYAGPPCEPVTALQGLRGYVRNTMYHPGCNAVNCTRSEPKKAVEIAKGADYVVLVMGLDQGEEREDHDRVDLELPGRQRSLITEVAGAAKHPVVLVLFSGGPVDISFAKHNPKIGSILWAGYPGEAGGSAIAEIIFGEHNPGGKLPVTWYPKDFIKVPMTDMRMRPDPHSGYLGRTYRFYTGPKVFEFGHGLSYTSYSYNFVSLSKKTLKITELPNAKNPEKNSKIHKLLPEIDAGFCEELKFSVVVGVENAGEMAGKHPVLLFAKEEKIKDQNEIKKLVGFKTIRLNSGGRGEVEFVVRPCEHLGKANEEGIMVIEEGFHYLVVGDKEYPIAVEA